MHEDGPRQAVLIATLAAPLPEEPEWRHAFLAGVRRWAEVLEVRADLVGDLDAATLRESFDGRLLYTLRSRHEGGAWDGTPERRHERIVAAAASYDLVDLEAARDLEPAVLEAVAEERRIVSWHGEPAELGELEDRFTAISRTPAWLYKMVVLATTPTEAMSPILLACEVGRDDLLAFAAGRAGAWTRFIAARYGAPVLYGAAAPASPGAPGQLTIEELVRDYGLPDLPSVRAFYGIVGNPVVSSSLSPRLHNGAYRELGISAAYLPFEAESLGDFWLDVVESDLFQRLGRPLLGLSVTVPFKRAALAVAGVMSPRVESIGAANTLTLHDGVWEAESTDPEGVLGALEEHGVTRGGQAGGGPRLRRRRPCRRLLPGPRRRHGRPGQPRPRARRRGGRRPRPAVRAARRLRARRLRPGGPRDAARQAARRCRCPSPSSGCAPTRWCSTSSTATSRPRCSRRCATTTASPSTAARCCCTRRSSSSG